MRCERTGDAPQRMVFGLIVLVLGVLFLLDKLDLVEMGSLFDYWPLVFVAIGFGRLVQSPGSRGRGMGIVFIVVGVWWTLSNLDVVEYDPLHYWPVILILVGGSILWRAIGGSRLPEGVSAPPPPPPPRPLADGPSGPVIEPASAPPPGSYDADAAFNAVAVLGGVERKSVTRDFRGGSMTAIMGGCVIDLRQAAISPGGAMIDAFALWGGVEIKVPRDWVVVSKGLPLLGGFVDSTTPPSPPTGKVLEVRGVAIMGGVEIKN
jgi:hypothetical protein